MITAAVDLHVHLDGSLPVRYQYEESLRVGLIPKDQTFEEYYNHFHPQADDYEHVFAKFDMPVDIMQTREQIIEATYRFIKMEALENILYCEMRFAPQLHTRKGMSQSEAIEAAIVGVQKARKDFPDTIATLLLTCMHTGDSAAINHEENIETIKLTKKYLGEEVVGADLAGYENNCDFNEYADIFVLARELCIPYTIHAGEMGEGANVSKAIAMGAYRIGHGINCIQKEEWVNEVVEKQIPLEICVTSNCTFDLKYSTHPIYELIEKGAYITINSDDISFDNCSLTNEHNNLYRFGLSEKQLIQYTLNAIDVAFTSDKNKRLIKEKYLQRVQKYL